MAAELPDFTKSHILVIGDIMLDRYWFGDAARISPEAPVPIVSIKQTDERPGGAGNVALNIAALGAKVTLLGITGKDEAANQLIQCLSEARVHSAIECVENIKTITKLRIISRHQQLIRLDFEEKFLQFDPQILIKTYQKHLKNVDLIILSDYGKGTLAQAQTLIQMAKAANVPVLVDPKGTNFSIYQGATIITPNLKEFETIVGPCQTNDEITTKARTFLNQYQIDSLLLTRGEQGMSLINMHQEEHLPAHAREVFDVTGAGDTVIAVLGAALAAKTSIHHAITLANFAAGLVVGKLGAATVTPPELQAFMGSTTHNSILNDEELLKAVSKAKSQGKKVVFTNGCFDILHAGHTLYLQQAKQLGDFLIVAVNEDDSIKNLKGNDRPINQTAHRMAVLASLQSVDWVTSFSEKTPERLLRYLQPDILVKGGDYTPDKVVGAEIVYAYGGQVRVLGLIKDLSTTTIINRIQNTQKQEC